MVIHAEIFFVVVLDGCYPSCRINFMVYCIPVWCRFFFCIFKESGQEVSESDPCGCTAELLLTQFLVSLMVCLSGLVWGCVVAIIFLGCNSAPGSEWWCSTCWICPQLSQNMAVVSVLMPTSEVFISPMHDNCGIAM